MAFERPSLTTIVGRIQADLESGLEGADARLRRSVERALAYALGGATHSLYGFLSWIAKQILPTTCGPRWVLRWASFYGIARKAATFAGGNIDATGTDSTVIEAGTVYQRNDDVEYTVDSDTPISGGTASVPVTAKTAGADGNADSGSLLSLVSPIAGVDTEATVDADGLGGGTDAEDIEDLRARVLVRVRTPPKGGGPGDYVAWALEVAGVTRAWEYRSQYGLGTIGVTFAMDDAPAGPIPDATTRQAVEDHIDSVAPLTAAVTVWIGIAVPLNPEISVSPDTSEVRTAVEAEFEDLYRREAEPGATILLSHLNEAISLAKDEEDHTLVSPTADVSHASNEMPTLGTITWV